MVGRHMVQKRHPFESPLERRRKGGKRKKKKIAPKIERSRNKLNFAFGRSWNRVFVTYRCAFHFISLSLIRNFRRKCNIPLRDAISKVHAKKYFRAYGKPVTERHPWNSMPSFDRNSSFLRKLPSLEIISIRIRFRLSESRRRTGQKRSCFQSKRIIIATTRTNESSFERMALPRPRKFQPQLAGKPLATRSLPYPISCERGGREGKKRRRRRKKERGGRKESDVGWSRFEGCALSEVCSRGTIQYGFYPAGTRSGPTHHLGEYEKSKK